MGIALEEQHADDEIILINDLKIAYSPTLKYYLAGKTIDYQRDFFGKWEFTIYGTNYCF